MNEEPRSSKDENETDELRPEYAFDYTKSRPNRFADQMSEGSIAVVLEPDVAAVFHDAAVVNRFLRSAIAAMPHEADERGDGLTDRSTNPAESEANG